MEHHDDVPTRIPFAGTENQRKCRRVRRAAGKVAACAAVIALAGTGLAGQGHAQVAANAVHDEAADAVQRVVDLVNAERGKAGCGPLRAEGKARSAAQSHADDMAARGYYDHTSPEGADAGDRLDAAGYRWRKWGENIHKGPSSPEDAVRDWMNSAEHRANIVNCDFNDLGVGVNHKANGPWWVQVFAS
ncbi:CAP domain-containing protein [Saccharothrix australiensis]|uniref:SCP domain-containing protein n=1 Tax=Saccharothrix australiensis TaxID=2072 RepID=A0A495W4T8_9PSEU|nr:CAP domain-containing protein [Saccharothrix australiensis]RKT56140.1 hypothetical protein C8E97_4829 [Saccharothrix australiensis]